MFESYTYEYILNRMLSRVPDSIDKREGSIIYTSLAPAAAELAQMYINMEIFLKLGFASTSSGEYLNLRTAEMGVIRQMATKAHRKGVFYASENKPLYVPIGSRFSIGGLNYVVIKEIKIGEYILECEIAGEVGNIPVGVLLPIDYVTDLVRAELTGIILEGMDEESDDKLLNRYYIRVRQPATSGNAHQYMQWAMEIPGVGGAKIFPLWNGPGTVKVVIIDSNKQPTSVEMVTAVSNHIEENRPIGATVTVKSAEALLINIEVTVSKDAGYTGGQIQNNIQTKVIEYLKSIAFVREYVSYAYIGSLLFDIAGILDYSALAINGNASNVVIGAEQVPVMGEVMVNVS